jgi:transcriptional regulator with XRE-family HTH domain
MDFRENARKNIRNFREALGITQGALDELSGVPSGTVDRIERGSRLYLPHHMGAIADVLNMTLADLQGTPGT